MWVKLRQGWFAPDARLYDPRKQRVFELPDDWKDLLPRTAEIVGYSETEPAGRQAAEDGDADELDALLAVQAEQQTGLEKAREAHNKQAEIDNARAKAAQAKKRGPKK